MGPVFPYSDATMEPAPTMVGTSTESDADRDRTVRKFLKDLGLLLSTGGVMGIVEMHAYVCRLCER